MGNAFHPPVSRRRPPRFRWAKSGAGSGGLPVGSRGGFIAGCRPDRPILRRAASAYRQASESFNKEDYSHALDLLEHAPEAGKPGEQADRLEPAGRDLPAPASLRQGADGFHQGR